MNILLLLTAVCTCLAIVSSNALAEVVFEQPPLSSSVANGTDSDTETGFQAFDDFSLSGNAAVNKISWYGYSAAVPDSQQYEISFYMTDPGNPYLPGMLYSQTALLTPTATNDTTLGLHVFTALIPSVLFDANTKYWLSIKQSGDPDYSFSWQHADQNQDFHAVLDLGTSAYYPAQNDLAFSLLASVPGDINNDAKVDVNDVLLATRIVLDQYTPTEAERLRADVVSDNQINAGDLVRIYQLALGS